MTISIALHLLLAAVMLTFAGRHNGLLGDNQDPKSGVWEDCLVVLDVLATHHSDELSGFSAFYNNVRLNPAALLKQFETLLMVAPSVGAYWKKSSWIWYTKPPENCLIAWYINSSYISTYQTVDGSFEKFFYDTILRSPAPAMRESLGLWPHRPLSERLLIGGYSLPILLEDHTRVHKINSWQKRAKL